MNLARKNTSKVGMPRKRRPSYNVGDLIDRLSILTRKIYFGEEHAISEHRHIEQQLIKSGLPGKLVTNVIRVTQMNIEIWNLEHELRKCAEGTAPWPLDEVGKRATRS